MINTTEQIILEALLFERDHWQALLDSRRQGWRAKGSIMRQWAKGRVAELQVIIDRLETAALKDQALQAMTNDWR